MDLILFFAVIVLNNRGIEKLYEMIWSKGLRATISFDEDHANEGEVGCITEVVTNEKRIPLPAIILKFVLDRSISYLLPENTNKSDLQYRNDCFVMKPFEKVTRKFEVIYGRRGYYTVPEVQLVATGPFYDSVYVDIEKNQAAVCVYPACTSVKEVFPSFERIMGEYLQQRFLYEDPFAFRGIRQYEPTDSMRKINWGVSARTGELMVNQYYDSSHCSITILLDLETEGMLYYEDLLEECIRITRTYLELCLQKGIPICLVTNACDIETKIPVSIEEGTGVMNFEECLRQLARLEVMEKMDSFLPYLNEAKVPCNGLAILISVSQAEQLQIAFEEYVGEGGYGEWVIPVYPSSQRRVQSRKVEVVYGEVLG
jgi:hypothetical protein